MTDTSSPLTRPQAAPSAPALTFTALATLLVGLLLPLIDFFIVNVALPTIEQSLHASPGMLQLVVDGYAITYALFLIIGGRVGDAVGRKRLFLIGMAGFTLTSLACGIAPAIGVLVAARALQGVFAALMLPQVLSTIQATTAGHERARAIGLYGATGGIATVTGQLVGGLLIDADIAGTGWRPIFLVNVPVGIIGLVVAWRVVPDTRSRHPLPVDVRGTLLLAVAVLALLIPLTEGQSLGWPLWTWVLLAASPVAFTAFIWLERRIERSGMVPMVPPSVVRVPSMRRGLAVVLPFYLAAGGFLFAYALALQDGARYSPLRTGVTLLPMAVAFFASSLGAARLVARYGHQVIVAGSSLEGLGMIAVLIAVHASWPGVSPVALIPGMILAGAGQGLVIPSLFGTVLSEVPAERAGIGSGVLTTTQQVALALGVATLGTLYLAESQPALLGAQRASELVLVVLLALFISISLLARGLPDPRGSSSQDEPADSDEGA